MRVTVFLTLLVSCLHLNAQEFKEGILYDVVGPVKDVNLNSKKIFPHLFDKASFNTNGKTKNSVTVFDDNGYPVSIDLDTSPNNDSGLHLSLKVNYDENHQVASILTEYNMAAEGDIVRMVLNENSFKVNWTENRSFQYRNNSFGVPEISNIYVSSVTNSEDYTSDYTYTDYVYDKHGNWISRNVVETIIFPNGPTPPMTNEYMETRDISYY